MSFEPRFLLSLSLVRDLDRLERLFSEPRSLSRRLDRALLSLLDGRLSRFRDLLRDLERFRFLPFLLRRCDEDAEYDELFRLFRLCRNLLLQRPELERLRDLCFLFLFFLSRPLPFLSLPSCFCLCFFLLSSSVWSASSVDLHLSPFRTLPLALEAESLADRGVGAAGDADLPAVLVAPSFSLLAEEWRLLLFLLPVTGAFLVTSGSSSSCCASALLLPSGDLEHARSSSHSGACR